MKKRNIYLILVAIFVLVISINVYADSCDQIFAGGLLQILNRDLYKPIKYVTPILLIVLTSFDFAKVVFSGTKEGMDKAKKNFFKRAVAALVIFFAPDLINFLVEIISQKDIGACINSF